MDRTTYNLFPISAGTQRDVFGAFVHLTDETLDSAERLHMNNLREANPTRYLFGLDLRRDIQLYGDRAEAYRAGVYIGGVLMRSVLRQHQIDPSAYHMPGMVADTDMRTRLATYEHFARTSSRFVLGQFFVTPGDMKQSVRLIVEERRAQQPKPPSGGHCPDEEVALAIIGLGDTLALYAALHGESFTGIAPVRELEGAHALLARPA
jgi:hypothetical protein